jgi:hypothetical protein
VGATPSQKTRYCEFYLGSTHALQATPGGVHLKSVQLYNTEGVDVHWKGCMKKESRHNEIKFWDMTRKPNSKQERHCTYKRNIEARSRNSFCHRKAISITYSE